MNLTDDEKQKALVLWGRGTFCKRMGISPQAGTELCREKGLLSQAPLARKKAEDDPTSFLKEVIAKADIGPAAKAMGISKSTLKSVLEEVGVRNGPKKAEDLEGEKDKVWDTAQRTGSLSLTAALYETTEAQLKKLGLDRDKLSDPVKHGYRARTGRLGELSAIAALESTPGVAFVQDLNVAEGFNTPGSDLQYAEKAFDRNILRKVSVKTVRPYRTRSTVRKGFSWSFAWPKTEECDKVMAVCLDEDDLPVAVLMRDRPLPTGVLSDDIKSTDQAWTLTVRATARDNESRHNQVTTPLQHTGWQSLSLVKAHEVIKELLEKERGEAV